MRRVFPIRSERFASRLLSLVQRVFYSRVDMLPKRNGSTWPITKNDAGSGLTRSLSCNRPPGKQGGQHPPDQLDIRRRHEIPIWVVHEHRQPALLVPEESSQTSANAKADVLLERGVIQCPSVKHVPLDGPGRSALALHILPGP